MGATHVTVAVTNPTDPERRWAGLFLVDTGAVDCYAPARHLRAVGIETMGKRTFELADGTEIAIDVGIARIEFMGEAVGAAVIFGNDDAVIAAQLQDRASQAAGNCFSYVPSHADRPGEADERQAHIVDHSLADITPRADDNVEHPIQAVIS